jgi:hypothetical protein
MKLTSADWGAPTGRITRKDLALCGAVLAALVVLGLWSKSVALRPGDDAVVMTNGWKRSWACYAFPVGKATSGYSLANPLGDVLAAGMRVEVLAVGQTFRTRVRVLDDDSSQTCWVDSVALDRASSPLRKSK